MKRIVSKIMIFIMCAMISLLTIDTTSVKADLLNASALAKLDSQDSYKFKQGVVFYLGINYDSKINKYSSYRGISQRYWKNHSKSLLYGENAASSTYVRSGYNFLSYANICSRLTQFGVCADDYSNVLDSLAEVAMDHEGNIRIYLKDGYQITNLRLYYAIATYVDTNSEIYCSQSGTICEGAKTIQGRNSNWKNAGKGQTLIYSQNSLEGNFEKKEKIIGDTNSQPVGYYYTGYNIFEHITSDYYKMAQQTGAYVTMSISISNGTNEYHANTPIVDNSDTNKGFSQVDDGTDKTKLEISRICEDASNRSCNEIVSKISSAAALVKPATVNDVDKSAGYSGVNEFFITTLKPIIMIVIGIMFIVSGSMTGATIIKSSDEPEARREAIKRLIGLFTGALVIELILLFYEPIIQFFSGLL